MHRALLPQPTRSMERSISSVREPSLAGDEAVPAPQPLPKPHEAGAGSTAAAAAGPSDAAVPDSQQTAPLPTQRAAAPHADEQPVAAPRSGLQQTEDTTDDAEPGSAGQPAAHASAGGAGTVCGSGVPPNAHLTACVQHLHATALSLPASGSSSCVLHSLPQAPAI
jgi:hypothetical protein